MKTAVEEGAEKLIKFGAEGVWVTISLAGIRKSGVVSFL